MRWPMACENLVLHERNVSLRQGVVEARHPDYPLIVALHGGTYTSAYYDLEEFSLVERAKTLGFPIIALDRPGYGETNGLSAEEFTHDGNSKVIEAIIGDYWEAYSGTSPGVFLIGHSIGGAIAAAIAARRPAWPLLGIAISGVGLHHAESNSGDLREMAGATHMSPPAEFKNIRMFGPAGTFHRNAQDWSRQADSPAPIQDIIDIVRTWPGAAPDILSKIEVPVHYRQAEFDALWKVDQDEIDQFARACSASAWIDAAIFGQSGHCIDFHRVGAAFQLEQLAFAIKCAVRADLTV